MNTCYTYDMKWWHYFIPSITEFRQLCDSYDKTYMFIVAFIRFIFYFIIFNYLINKNVVAYGNDDPKFFLFILLLTINLVSSFLLLYAIFRKQTNKQKQDKISYRRPIGRAKPLIPIQVFDDGYITTPEEYSQSGL